MVRLGSGDGRTIGTEGRMAGREDGAGESPLETTRIKFRREGVWEAHDTAREAQEREKSGHMSIRRFDCNYLITFYFLGFCLIKLSSNHTYNEYPEGFQKISDSNTRG